MRTEVLQGFIEIVHENSIRKAAQKLGVPQQTLNKNITSLETELGVRVLERSNQGVQLTDAGTEVYQFAKWCLQEYLAVRDECMECLGVDSEVSKQHVTLGCVNTAIQNIVSQAIAELYRVKYPFELSVVQDGAFDIIEKIKKDDYQIGITLQYQSATNHYPEFEDTLQFIPIYESKPYVWVSKKNVLANLNRMDQTAIQRQSVIRLKDNDEKMTTYIFEYNGVDDLEMITCDNIYYATHMLSRNLGIVLDMKTDKYLNLEKMLREIAVPLPLKLKDDYKIVTGILVKTALLSTEVGRVIEYLLQQKNTRNYK